MFLKKLINKLRRPSLQRDSLVEFIKRSGNPDLQAKLAAVQAELRELRLYKFRKETESRMSLEHAWPNPDEP